MILLKIMSLSVNISWETNSSEGISNLFIFTDNIISDSQMTHSQ